MKNKTINIHIKNVDKILSEFSCDENLMLSSDFVAHYEETYLQTKTKGSYRINLTTDNEVSPEDEKRAQIAFKKHYESEVDENNLRLKEYNRKAIILFIISAVIFTFLFYLYQIEEDVHHLIISLLQVASWAVTFKLIDSLAFFRIETLMSRRRNIWARDAQLIVTKKSSPTKN